jgi:uncharacterized protein YjbJ (UPF0337 family)
MADSGPSKGAKGAVEDIKGKAKEALGHLSSNRSLQREGEAQQDKAAAEREVAKREGQAEKARAEEKLHEGRERTHRDE